MNALTAAAESLGIDCTPYEDYSGRGMYGKTTCAVTVSSIAGIAAITAIAGRSMSEAEFAAFLAEVRSARTDELGRDTIVY